LCEFVGLPVRVIAENGGVVCIEEGEGDDPYGGGRFGEGVVFNGDREAADAVAREYEAAGHALGWGDVDLVNRWRETEIAVAREQPLGPLEEIAASHGLEVVDTGYAYHVKSPDVDKDLGLETAAKRLGYNPEAFVAVGDSENDAEMFAVAGESYAVANADEHALEAADHVTDESYADGFLEALERAAD
jgi:hydroxymethylpyrimidine pyrophosphatase-like HAD family hydrolase